MMRVLLLASALISALATNPVGLKFLEDNGKKDGVVTLPSGLQYKVLRQGEGQRHPTANSPCVCKPRTRQSLDRIVDVSPDGSVPSTVGVGR